MRTAVLWPVVWLGLTLLSRPVSATVIDLAGTPDASGLLNCMNRNFADLNTPEPGLYDIEFDGLSVFGPGNRSKTGDTVKAIDGSESLLGTFGLSDDEAADIGLSDQPAASDDKAEAAAKFAGAGGLHLAYGPDGNFYASSNGCLYEFDALTGVGRFIGPFGPFGAGLYLQSLYSADGNLYGFNGFQQYLIDMTTGSARLIRTNPGQAAPEKADTKSATPEPGSFLLLLAGGAVGLWRYRRRLIGRRLI